MSLRVVVVDDEPLARRRLRRLLRAHDDVEVVGEAANGDEAVDLVLEVHPEALFIDVRMPGSDGLAALRRLREKLPADIMPMAVFTTAYEDYAVAAFELEGTDYLVKPIDKAALARAMQRLRKGTWSKARADLDAAPRALGEANPSAQSAGSAAGPAAGELEGVGHLAAHRAGKIVRLALADIGCIVLEDTIAWAVTAAGRFRLRQGLGQLEERLPCPPFFRVSRSAMVNVSWIDHLAPMFSGTYSVFLKKPLGLEMHVSRRRARHLRQLLGW